MCVCVGGGGGGGRQPKTHPPPPPPPPPPTLTVATPGAPAVRADSNGEIPPKAAPYPTLVGTAICRQERILVITMVARTL